MDYPCPLVNFVGRTSVHRPEAVQVLPHTFTDSQVRFSGFLDDVKEPDHSKDPHGCSINPGVLIYGSCVLEAENFKMS